jgi:hypothetical protein
MTTGFPSFEMPGIGHGMRVGGRDSGGLIDLEGPDAPPGRPPPIGAMVKVENADAACARVVALGGTTGPAFDVGGLGRMAGAVGGILMLAASGRIRQYTGGSLVMFVIAGTVDLLSVPIIPALAPALAPAALAGDGEPGS